MKTYILSIILAAAFISQGESLRNSRIYTQSTLPPLLSAISKSGSPVKFSLETPSNPQNRWEFKYSERECIVKICKMPFDAKASTQKDTRNLNIEITSLVQTPVLIEIILHGPEASIIKQSRLMLYTAECKKTNPIYPKNETFKQLKAEIKKRGIEITDWHIHIRGGMTPEDAAARETDSGIRSSAMENHGREWEIFDNNKLRSFAEKTGKIKINGRKMPVGIQVNDRDWFKQIDELTRAQFDYILADTMIMGKLPNGRDNRLWQVKEIADADKWMEEYMNHNMRILDEPIDILANPTYLPAPVADDYDRLWTEERMRKIISKAVEKGIALEIQAESPFPKAKFLILAKEMGAKFSFGTNNFDAKPKDLSRWLEAIKLMDLKADDIWTPKCKIRNPVRKQ